MTNEVTTPIFGRKAVALLTAGALLASALPARAADLTIDDGVVVEFGAGAQLVVRDRLNAGKGSSAPARRTTPTAGKATPRRKPLPQATGAVCASRSQPPPSAR